MTGRCRFCGCTDLRGCPEGCWWVNTPRTVCSSCEDVQRAWLELAPKHRLPNMTRAFARGFRAANGRELGDLRSNPFVSRLFAKYWELGASGVLRELAKRKAAAARRRRGPDVSRRR